MSWTTVAPFLRVGVWKQKQAELIRGLFLRISIPSKKKSKFLQIKPFDTFFCDYTNFLLVTKNVNVPSQQCKAIFIPAFDDEITFFREGIRTQKLKNCALFIWLLSLSLAENRSFEQNNIKFRKKKNLPYRAHPPIRYISRCIPTRCMPPWTPLQPQRCQ